MQQITYHEWGVAIQDHYGASIEVDGESYTDVEFPFTLTAFYVGKVIGITHLLGLYI